MSRRVARNEVVYAPHLIDAEVAQSFRRFALCGDLSLSDARVALQRLQRLPMLRVAHGGLLPRAFELRSNVTIYDGLYVALAEALDVPLLSCDSALQDVPGSFAEVEILPSSPAARA